jgi:hypothetical protein
MKRIESLTAAQIGASPMSAATEASEASPLMGCPCCRRKPDLCEMLPGGPAYRYCGRCGWRGPVRRNASVATAAWNRSRDRASGPRLGRLIERVEAIAVGLGLGAVAEWAAGELTGAIEEARGGPRQEQAR